jgi:hypothetical protein
MAAADPNSPTARLPHLTGRQARFVDEYTTDRNGTRAYLAAGYRVRDNDRQVAAQKASALLCRPQVRAAVERRMAEYAAAQCRRFTPLTPMMANLEYWFDLAIAPDDGSADGLARREEARRRAQAIAREAAPYVHPKMQPVAPGRPNLRR